MYKLLAKTVLLALLDCKVALYIVVHVLLVVVV